jgi:ATP-dependent exoDNAse (exonuclease V) beta subunit
MSDINWNKLYTYPPCSRSSSSGERLYNIGKAKLPSVTTILQATMPEEKKQKLAEWRQRVGENKAEDIKNSAATRGTAMHTYLEHYIDGKRLLDLTDVGRVASVMAETIIDRGFGDLSELWGSEVTLYYEGLYAGATDAVGVYQGRDSIIDFKQSNKPKRDEWITDYKIQMAAYASAHDQMHGTSIEQGVILMCTPDNFFQRFIINGSEFRDYRWEWLKRVDEYYKNHWKQ